MKRNLVSANAGVNRLFRGVAAEKKKVVLALSLIAVMLVMWVRLIIGKKPNAAEATTKTEQNSSKDGSGQAVKVSFVNLPKVKGRNDIITRDFFDCYNWRSFNGNIEGGSLNDIQEVDVFAKDGSEEVITRVAQKLKLEAIFLADNPQVFINKKLLSVGDKLFITDAGDTYEFEVVGIYENIVLIRCGQARITLKLAQIIDVVD